MAYRIVKIDRRFPPTKNLCRCTYLMEHLATHKFVKGVEQKLEERVHAYHEKQHPVPSSYLAVARKGLEYQRRRDMWVHHREQIQVVEEFDFAIRFCCNCVNLMNIHSHRIRTARSQSAANISRTQHMRVKRTHTRRECGGLW